MSRNILLVEDDDNDIFFFRRAMKLAGWSSPVQVVQDGKQALEYLDGQGQFSCRDEFPLPSLVLLDIKLPYLSGLEILKWIREHATLKQLTVIMLTSSKEESDIERACVLGANAYVVKPTRSEDLLDLVGSIGRFWIKYNQFCPGLSPVGSH